MNASGRPADRLCLSQSCLLGRSSNLSQGRWERRTRPLRRERRYSHRRASLSPPRQILANPRTAGRRPLLQHPHAPQVPPFLLGRIRANRLGPPALLDPQRWRGDGVQEGGLGVSGRQYAGGRDGVGEYWRALWGGGEEGVGRGRCRGCGVGGQGEGVVQRRELWRKEGDVLVLYQSCVSIPLPGDGTDGRTQID